MYKDYTSKDVINLIKDKQIKFVDLRFMDFPGLQQHFTFPVSQIDEEVFESGIGFDGSSIRGWQSIHESDMLVLPDPRTAFVDPFSDIPTLVIYCNILDPITKERYTRDPRNIAQKAENYLMSTGLADTCYIGPEAEFFIFDDIRCDQTANSGYYFIDSIEGIWNSGRDEKPNLGYKLRYKEGYFPIPPADATHNIRSEMVALMLECGIDVECHHHEVATGGQAEIDMRYAPLTQMADQLTLYKYIIKNVAKRNGKTVTFMPKPLFGDNGSGMHCHISLWKGGKPTFAGNKYAGLSQEALWFIGGLLKHAPALVAITNPTTNSYKRLVPGYEAPVNIAYSARNRSACCRIPMYSPSPKAKRIEFRVPDPSCNPYMAFAALLMAGLDGIQNKIDPGEPMDKDLYDLPPEEKALIPQVPGSLAEALNALSKDHEFLTKGDVFTEDVLKTWIEYKRVREVEAVNLRPHPYEFMLYFDI
ncbi:MAG TPA: type I glutamate--ammonia ligase [Candidatus Hydrogenedens sp.]|nr:type I glutamate--ammonia ligase [Candidatus Hydrogenedens sp.]HOK10138.1 type I glutamate--ammonia ligase [Candidatus Hydrogenedens sp.]HOL19435.1 type I glutamate--ammonia ligase [Candidatus Hydrogenedens sp.]HPP58264.1 type I glutamate--ammonia ligase [Candidatus Hydrogenedens sp.]